MSCGETCYERNDSIEEQFMWLLRFASFKKIKEFFSKNRSSIDLHYPTQNLRTPLTTVIDRDDPRILSVLLERNSTSLDETTTQPYGRTALMYASYVSREPKMLEVLLENGADIGKRDTRGWTCLQYAVVGERLKNVIVLLDSGTSVNQQDFQGRTPLMISVYLSNLDILLFLLDRGAEIEVRDNAGLTTLQVAILSRKRDASCILIERGADTSVVTPTTKASIGQLCRTSMPGVLRSIEPQPRTTNT
ncbi:PREDICTED: ankyrin repeat domain-containing protein 50-like, partial [Dufourea novaeangliae]|uniref:ankyrin repeat domain-containing protein 50-like n=1 Tax=Dufourea novaeangliae TaxID=178035 RepID=UPI00076760FC